MFWFLLAAVFFVLWVRARSNNGGSGADEYSRGYTNGYEQFRSQLADILTLDSSKQHAKLTKLAGGKEPENLAVEDIGDDKEEAATLFAAETTNVARPSIGVEVVEPQPILTEKELAEEKEQSTLRNLNTALYMASFLFVAAAAAFVGAAMPAGVKLAGLIVVVALFYGAGIALHTYSIRLRPAATAFIGTGLAILPFAGLALTTLGGMTGETAWLVTSIFGLVAYYVAAIILQNQFISYLSVAFVLSLASSMVATASLPIVWYFVVLIAISLAASSISYLKPSWVPAVFSKPVESTGQIVTPLALVASLFVTEKASIDLYEIVFGMATAHYLVAWLQRRTIIYETAVRVLAHATLLIVSWDVLQVQQLDDMRAMGIIWLVLACMQVVYSVVRVQLKSEQSHQYENSWLIGMASLVVGGALWWIGDAYVGTLTAISIAVAGLIALAAVVRLRDTRWVYAGLGASVLLPFIIGRWAATEYGEPWSWSVMVGVFTALAVCGLGLYVYLRDTYSQKSLYTAMIAVASYVLMILLCGFAAYDLLVTGWAFMLSGVIIIAFSHASKDIAVEAIGAILSAIAVWLWLSLSPIEDTWYIVVGSVAVTGLLGAGAFVYHLLLNAERRNSYIALALISYFGVVLTMISGSPVVEQVGLMLMIAGTASALVMRMLVDEKSQILKNMFTSGYLAYAAALVVFGIWLDDGWPVLALVAAALSAWIASYVEKIPYMLFVGNLLLVLAIGRLWLWLDFPENWMILGTAWLSSVVFYGVYALALDHKDVLRQWISLLSTWIVLGGAVFLTIISGDVAIASASAATLIVIAATVVLHGYLRQQKDTIEIGIYIAIAGLQRLVYLVIPGLDWIVYAHWWALVTALMAFWRADETRVQRLMIATGIVTASVGLSALSGNAAHQLLFLFEHIGLIMIGVQFRQRWALWWGVVASVLAVLYFLKDYLYLWLALLGLLLLGLVMWRLKVMGDRKES
jgi:hypothetical protein